MNGRSLDDGERLVELEGCHNFRDLGGYTTYDGRRVRRGRLFRSDGLHELTTRDIRRLREEVGIRAIVDLRTEAEAETENAGALALPPVAYHRVPLIIRAGEMRGVGHGELFQMDRFYLGLMRYGAERVRRVIELLAASDAPVVFHCAAGKDRTGVVSAVVLGLLGVAEAQIVADYALTRRGLEAIRGRLLRSAAYREMLGDLPRDTMHANPETMTALLAQVRQHWGSMAGYARSSGLDEATIERLRVSLLEAG